MPAKDSKCIYCAKSFDPTRGEGDHVLPAALGDFKGALRFRGVCVACNNRLGRFEQHLLQCGPGSVFRPMLKSASKRTRRRGRSTPRAVDGVPTPTFTIEHDGYRRLVHRSQDDPKSVTPIDCLTAKDASGRAASIQLFDGMQLNDVRQRLRAAGLDLSSVKEVFYSVAETEKWIDLIRKLLPDGELTELSPDEVGVRPVRVRVESTVTPRYYLRVSHLCSVLNCMEYDSFEFMQAPVVERG